MNTHTMDREARKAAALKYLEDLLAEGRELHDACTRAAQSFTVTAEELRAAYGNAQERAWQQLQDEREARHEEGVSAPYRARGQGNLH